MIKKDHIFFVVFCCLMCVPLLANAATNPDLFVPGENLPEIDDIETAFEVVCNVGMVHSRISNNTVLPGGTNEWTILFGDDTSVLPSMTWLEPEIYSNNLYLYFGSLRIGRSEKLLHLSTDTSDTLIVSQAISDFDTYFYISDISPLVPPEDSLGIGVHQYSYAWDETDADDFIIYEFWMVNLNQSTIDSVYVALHADCDISGAGGGSGLQGFWRDDMVDYYRDDVTGEYISYMYDGDNPNIPGNDIGGKLTPKESRGYIGSRLLYCPPIMGSSTPSVQQGHGWWDWNSDPGEDPDWMAYMRDGLWLDPPPSVHDFRFLQKLGPFEIPVGDSIKVAFAFGVGNGLQGLRSNLNTARILFDHNYMYQDIPPTAPFGFNSQITGNNIEFSWLPNEEPDLAGYNIYRAADPQGPFELINSSLIDTSYFQYRKFERGVYYFYVTAVDNDGNESTPSEMLSLSLLPDPPASFRAIPGNNSVTFRWNIIPGDDSYKILRSQISGGPYTEIAEIEYPDHQYTDNNVFNFQTYYYVAQTIDRWYQSPYSGEVEVTPDPANNGRVLLVDDYQETDEWGNVLKYQQRRRFYERWGVRNFDYDVWSIADQGMVDSSVILNYQAVVFASDGVLGDADGTWWFDIGAPGQSSLHYYMENGGRLLAIGQMILPWIWNTIPPMPGDFEYEWFGIDSAGDGWDNEWWFTWAIGAEPGYPDSMKIDVAKNGDQDEYASCVYSFRPGGDTLYTWGLWVDGDPPPPDYYQHPVGIIYRPGGTAISALMNFGLYFMANLDAQQTMTNILRDEFGCTYYEDPPPLPPWNAEVVSIIGEGLLLTWDAIDEGDVVSINLYRGTDERNLEYIESLDKNTGSFLDTTCSPGISYHYTLTTVDFMGQESERSLFVSEIGGRPPIPQGLTAVSGIGEVSLYWDETPDPEIDSLILYREINFAGNYTRLASIPAGDTSYIDLNVTNGSSYRYFATFLSIFGAESYHSDTVYAFPHIPGQRSGILIVNGIHGPSYDYEVYNLYFNRALTGDFDYHFWDLLDAPPSGGWPYPETIIGSGPLDQTVFNTYELIIWAGNAFNGDFEHWEYNLPVIMGYLNTGGNLMLPCRQGEDFLSSELEEYAHITDFYSWVTLDSLVSQVVSLTDISSPGTVSRSSLVLVDSNYVDILYRDVNYPNWVAGFYFDPDTSEGGKLVYLAGRPYRWDLAQLRYNCEYIISNYFVISMEPRSGMTELELPKEFILFQNYPNPFNPNTIIKFGLPVNSDVRLEIYDILGRSVKVLTDGDLEAGYHEIIWDGKNRQGNDIASGVYFYRLETESFSDIKKMLLLK